LLVIKLSFLQEKKRRATNNGMNSRYLYIAIKIRKVPGVWKL